MSSEKKIYSVFATNYNKPESGKSKTNGLVGAIAAVEMLCFK